MDKTVDLYFLMMDLNDIHKAGDMKTFLYNLKAYYPNAYSDLAETIKKLDTAKEVAALFRDVSTM